APRLDDFPNKMKHFVFMGLKIYWAAGGVLDEEDEEEEEGSSAVECFQEACHTGHNYLPEKHLFIELASFREKGAEKHPWH
ncbi:hypothetical protein ACJX0J_016224, partial [Zea mays]